MEFFSADYGWLLLAYVVGTLFGLYYGYNRAVNNVTEKIIDSLIDAKMLKTEGHGDNMEIIPWTEWCDDQTSK
jgi:hypothetical protein